MRRFIFLLLLIVSSSIAFGQNVTGKLYRFIEPTTASDTTVFSSGLCYIWSNGTRLRVHEDGATSFLVSSGGTTISFGSNGEIPITNSGGDGFTYSSSFTKSNILFNSASTLVTIDAANTMSLYAGSSNSSSLLMNTSGATLDAQDVYLIADPTTGIADFSGSSCEVKGFNLLDLSSDGRIRLMLDDTLRIETDLIKLSGYLNENDTASKVVVFNHADSTLRLRTSSSLGGGGGSVSFGTENQIPTTNSTTDDYSYGNMFFDPANNTFWGGDASAAVPGGTQTFTWGDDNTNNGDFGSACFGEASEIETSVGSALSVAENGYIAAYGGKNLSRGGAIRSGGIYSFIGGWYSPGSTNGKTNLKAPQVSGAASFGWYETNGSQTDNHGINSSNSVILGSLNPNIPSTSARTVILSGNGIKARANDPDQAYLANLNIWNTPTQNDTLVDILVRNPVDSGRVSVRDISTFAYIDAAYGEIYIDGGSSVTTVVTAGTFYNVENFTTGLSSFSTPASTGITIDTDGGGVYKVNLSCSFSATANALVEMAVFVNGTRQPNITLTRKVSAGGDVGRAACSGLLELSDSDVVTVKATSDSNGDTVTPLSGNLNIKRVSK